MVKWIVCYIVIPAILTLLFVLALSPNGRAEARTHRHDWQAGSRSWHAVPKSHRVGYRKSYKKKYAKRKHRRDANGNIALAIVSTANGNIAKVAAPFAEKFQTLIKMIEADTVYPERPDLNAKGNRIGDIGCYTRGGHMPGSKHYRGLACDIDQTKRNVTSAFMYHVTPLARLVGLTDGGTWPRKANERYTGPDAGHIEVPTSTIVAERSSHAYSRSLRSHKVAQRSKRMGRMASARRRVSFQSRMDTNSNHGFAQYSYARGFQ